MSCPRIPPVANVSIGSLIVLLSGACSQEQPAPASPQTTPETRASTAMPPTGIDACAWITRDEGAATLGEAIQPPANQIVSQGGEDRAAISQCRYQSSQSAARTLTVFARRSPVPENNPAAVRETLSSTGVSVEDVSGIGKHAFWAAGQLHVFANEYLYLIITVSGLTDADGGREQALSIAQRVLQRI